MEEVPSIEGFGNEKDGVVSSGAEIESDNNERPACFKSTFQELCFVFIATMAMAMGPFLNGAVIVISTFVGRDLDMTTAQETWLVASSSLASGSLLLFFGRVSDLFGRKSLIIVSFFFFSVFSLAAGFAKTPIALDVLNGVLGIFSASALPPAIGALGVIYEKPSKRKNAVFASFSGGNPVGFAIGMIFSGIATQIFNWRASYYLLAIIYLALTIVSVFAVPKDTTPKRTLNWDTVKEFDIIGTALTIAGIGMFSAALSLGPTASQGWKTGYVLALLLVGLALIVAFVFWELHFPHPLMPMHIWSDKNFSVVMVILLLGFMSFPVSIFFIALFFQNVWHYSPIESALHLLPAAVMGILVNIFAGLFLHRINNKLLMLTGTMAYVISFLLLALNKSTDSYWAFCFPSFCLAVLGADLEFNVANMYVMSSLPKDQQGTAGGIFQMVTRLFTTIGYGVATAVFNAVAENPSWGGYWKDDKTVQSYSASFWCSVAFTAVSMIMVPFLTIGTQGGKKK